MKQALMLAAAWLAVLGLAGCKMNLTADLYSSDIRDAASGTTGLSAPATLAFQVPGVDECAKHTAEISEIMAGVVQGFAPRGCSNVEMDSYLLADIQMPLVAPEAWGQAEALFGLVVSQRESGDIEAMVGLNLDKYEILTSRMQDKFHQKVDLEKSNVTLVMNNDERTPANLSLRDKFVNALPVGGNSHHEVARRHKIEIRLSDVSTADLALTGLAGAFLLRKK